MLYITVQGALLYTKGFQMFKFLFLTMVFVVGCGDTVYITEVLSDGGVTDGDTDGDSDEDFDEDSGGDSDGNHDGGITGDAGECVQVNIPDLFLRGLILSEAKVSTDEILCQSDVEGIGSIVQDQTMKGSVRDLSGIENLVNLRFLKIRLSDPDHAHADLLTGLSLGQISFLPRFGIDADNGSGDLRWIENLYMDIPGEQRALLSLIGAFDPDGGNMKSFFDPLCDSMGGADIEVQVAFVAMGEKEGWEVQESFCQRWTHRQCKGRFKIQCP